MYVCVSLMLFSVGTTYLFRFLHTCTLSDTSKWVSPCECFPVFVTVAVCAVLKLVSCSSAAVMAGASLSSFPAQQDHFSCCSNPVRVVTVAACSAVQEDWRTGLSDKGFVLVYWYFPIKLNWIHEFFRKANVEKAIFLNNQQDHFCLILRHFKLCFSGTISWSYYDNIRKCKKWQLLSCDISCLTDMTGVSSTHFSYGKLKSVKTRKLWPGLTFSVTSAFFYLNLYYAIVLYSDFSIAYVPPNSFTKLNVLGVG